MALFGKKKEKRKKSEVVEKSSVAQTMVQPEKDLSHVIKKPRITEKAVRAIDQNIYTFEVKKDATKNDVRAVITQLYNVTPIKIRIVNKKPRHYVSRMRGRNMMEKGLKKAYVYLKEGDRIDLA